MSVPGITEADRALSALLHDLRSPLGVAHGYLRLIREQRLPTPEEFGQAVAQTQAALRRMSELCDNAAAFLVVDGVPGGARVGVPVLLDRVARRLRDHGLPLPEPVAHPPGCLRAGTSADDLAEAIVVMLSAAAEGGAEADVRVEARGEDELWFATGAGPLPGADEMPPWFNARSGHGLGVPLACRVLTRAGGRIWTTESWSRVAIALPLETPE